MSLLFKAPHTSQPQGSVELAPEWRARKFASLIVASQPSIELVSRGGVSLVAEGTGSAPTLGIGSKGQRIVGNRVDAMNGGRIAAPYPALPINGDVTLIFVGGGFNTSSNSMLIALRSNSAGNPLIQLDNNNSDLRFLVRNDAATIVSLTAAGTASYSGSKVIIARRSGPNTSLWINGVSVASSGSAPTGAMSINSLGLLAAQAGSSLWQNFNPCFTEMLGVISMALTDAEIKSLSSNPWQIFAPRSRTLWIPGTVSAGGNSQSIGITLDGVTVATSQTLQHAQSIAATLDGISVAASQTATHAQAITATLDSITASVDQAAGSGISQSITATLDGVTVAASQTLRHGQSLTATLDGITVSTSQVVGSGTYQSLAITLDDVTASASQALTHDQLFQATLDSIGVSASQVVRHGQALAWSLDDVTVQVVQVGAATDAIPAGRLTFEPSTAAYSFEPSAGVYTFEPSSNTYSFEATQ